MREKQAKTIQERFGFADPDLKTPEHDAMMKWLDRNMEDIAMLLFKLEDRPKDITTEWEPVITAKEDGGPILGFADLLVTIRPTGQLAERTERMDHYGRLRILFEVKPKIESLGTLFRQVRMYQQGYVGSTHVGSIPFIIVCPDDSEADLIREQGLGFLKYDPNMLFKLGGV